MWTYALVVGAGLASGLACKDHGASSARDARLPPPGATVEQELAAIVASCAEVIGTVEVRRKGQPQWDPIRVGAMFRERDWVRTGAGAFARIRIFDRGFVELRENTTILVDTAISIETGSLVGVAVAGAEPIVVKAADGSEARISTPAGAEPVEFRLTPATGKALEIAVTKGHATISTREGETIVNAGQAIDLANGRAQDLVSLLGFPRSISPGVDARFLFVAAKPITLTWAPVPDAARYLVQVSRDTDFRTLVFSSKVDDPTAVFRPDSKGTYAWRVAAVDARGRLGELGFARRMYLEEEPPTELLIAPRDGAKFGFSGAYPQIVFSWQSAGGARRYKLVVRRADQPTSAPLVSTVTEEQQVELGMLREGTYSWGVYAVDGTDEVPLFLQPRVLTIRRQRVKANTDGVWK